MQANISDSDLGQYAESVQGDMATDLQSNSSKEQRFLKAANKQIKLCGQIMDQPVVGKYFFPFIVITETFQHTLSLTLSSFSSSSVLTTQM